MKNKILVCFIIPLFILMSACYAQQEQINTYGIKSSVLEKKRTLISNGDKNTIVAKETLLKRANKILAKSNPSIVSGIKNSLNISPNDFVSLAPYWWPNPNGKNLPYIPMDGKINPERNRYADRVILKEFSEDIETLGLAYYYSKDEKYAQKAIKQLRVFFLDPKTKMNPNFDNSQLIVGKPNESGNIIEANPLLKCIDGIQLIKSSKSWTNQDQIEIKQWFEDLLNWMLTDKEALKFSRAKNNIGSYYLIQASTYALFVDKKDIARELIEEKAPGLINYQIEKNGSMPLELKRAKPWNYLNYNLNAYLSLMELSAQVGVNLWEYQSNAGSIKKAFEWLIPYANGKANNRYNIPSKDALNLLMRVHNLDIPNSLKHKYKPSNFYYHVLTEDINSQ